MSKLKNSFHTELAIGILINDEKELKNKLNMLTEIGLTASNPEVLAICERFRDRLCGEQVSKERKDLLRGSETQRIYKTDPRDEESNEIYGEE